MTERKRVVVVGRLPERLSSADRIAHAHEDVTNLTAQMQRNARDRALTMSVTGWAIEEDSEEFVVNGRTVVLSLVVSRE